jgi:hypothetical protein
VRDQISFPNYPRIILFNIAFDSANDDLHHRALHVIQPAFAIDVRFLAKCVFVVLGVLIHEAEPAFEESFNKPFCNLPFSVTKLFYCKQIFLDEKLDKDIKEGNLTQGSLWYYYWYRHEYRANILPFSEVLLVRYPEYLLILCLHSSTPY